MTESKTPENWSRRDSLRLFAGGASIAALFQVPGVANAAAALVDGAPLTLTEIRKLTPVEIAKRSPIVVAAYQYLLNAADEIENPALRQAVTDILKTPAPRVLERLNSDAAKAEVRQTLIDAKLLAAEITVEQLFPPAPSAAEPSQPFLSAPGSGYASHHAYPGGLSTHVALNTRSSLGLYAGYRDTFGSHLSRDIVLASQLLHDLHKPWVFQWKADGSLLKEYPVAGTGAHHILSLAESIYRGLPADMIVAQASAHDAPGSDADEAKTVAYLKAGAIIAGKDPVQYGLLSADGKSVPQPRRVESFITHIGDHDFIIAMPANTWTTPVLKEIAAADYGLTPADLDGEAFNAFRNYVYAQATMIGLHNVHVTGGKDAVRAVVRELIKA